MTMEFLGSDPNSDNPFPSKFEFANGGTLYLEHIECLNSEIQAALLHLLKTGLINRLNHTIVPVDVRIIASSDTNLSQYVDEERFGRHLMYELQAFDIPVPSLKEFSGEKGQNIILTEDAMKLLTNYGWPGNNRELRNVLERSLSFSDGKTISSTNLPETLVQQVVTGTKKEPSETRLTLAEVEKNTILQAAKYCHGKPGKICVELDINRTTLWRKLKTFSIDLNDYKSS